MKILLLSLTALILLLAVGCASMKGAVPDKQAEYHFQMGQSNLAENNITAALIEFSTAEKIAPERPDILYNLGIAYFRKGKLEIAEQKFLKAISIKPDYSAARNELGVVYLEMKRWDDAINHLKLVSDDIFFPNQSAALINIGLAYFGKGDYMKSLEIFRGLAVEQPGEPRGHLNLGKVYFALDKIDLAINSYNRALELYPDYAQAHYNLALAFLKKKDLGKASFSFMEVLRIVPDAEIGHLSREYLDSIKVQSQ